MNLAIRKLVLVLVVILLSSCVKKNKGYNSFLIKNIEVTNINDGRGEYSKRFTVKENGIIIQTSDTVTYNDVPFNISGGNLIQENAIPSSKFSSRISIDVEDCNSPRLYARGNVSFFPSEIEGEKFVYLSDYELSFHIVVELVWY